MNRLKFRCWHRLREVMYDVFELHNGHPTIALGPRNEQYLFQAADQKHLVVMQASPYNDRDGKPIFERDIVKCVASPRMGHTGEVKFDDGCWIIHFNEAIPDPDDPNCLVEVELLHHMAKLGLELVGYAGITF